MKGLCIYPAWGLVLHPPTPPPAAVRSTLPWSRPSYSCLSPPCPSGASWSRPCLPLGLLWQKLIDIEIYSEINFLLLTGAQHRPALPSDIRLPAHVLRQPALLPGCGLASFGAKEMQKCLSNHHTRMFTRTIYTEVTQSMHADQLLQQEAQSEGHLTIDPCLDAEQGVHMCIPLVLSAYDSRSWLQDVEHCVENGHAAQFSLQVMCTLTHNYRCVREYVIRACTTSSLQMSLKGLCRACSSHDKQARGQPCCLQHVQLLLHGQARLPGAFKSMFVGTAAS